MKITIPVSAEQAGMSHIGSAVAEGAGHHMDQGNQDQHAQKNHQQIIGGIENTLAHRDPDGLFFTALGQRNHAFSSLHHRLLPPRRRVILFVKNTSTKQTTELKKPTAVE